MTKEEFAKEFSTRLLESQNPVAEAKLIASEIDTMIDDENSFVSQNDKEKIIEDVRITVQEEIDRGQMEREADEEELDEALDLLEKGQI
jgi:hypothetical protein